MRDTAELAFELVILFAVALPITGLIWYIAVRLTSAAWHRSKNETLNTRKNGHG